MTYQGQDSFTRLKRSLKEDLKQYLGYAPYYSNHLRCGDDAFKRELERKHGKSLQELLDLVDMKIIGGPAIAPTKSPDAAMVRALKKIYEVESLWFYEGKWDSPHSCATRLDLSRKQLGSFELKRWLEYLSGEVKLKSPRYAKVLFEDTGIEHTTLDSLRAEILIIKLSGL